MGGTMDYGRARNRNGIGRRQPLSSFNPYPDADWTESQYPLSYHGIVGDLNRMERDVLGLNRTFGDMLLEECVKGTGVDIEDARSVLRWFLNWPEPYCQDCKAPEEAWPRCTKHQGRDW